MAASENPPAHSGLVRTASGTSTPPLPNFFLDRYVPSYLREWEAFLAQTAPMTGADARAPLVIGLAAWRSAREGRPVRLEEIA
jgi:myo-inositol 2-dehydrogenase/D-chiro-inositol 1-dehydrogenase